MTNTQFLKEMNFAKDYLDMLNDKDYRIINLNMIEPFFIEDKEYHPSAISFEKNNQLKAIRSDWTRSILNYKTLYNLKDKRLAYYGPVIRQNQTISQAGIEIYEADAEAIIEAIKLHLTFIKDQTDQPLTTIIMNDEDLLDLFIDRFQLGDDIRQLIYEKDISALENALGRDHEIYQLLIQPVSKQFDAIEDMFGYHHIVQLISGLREELKDYGMKFIVDLSFRSPQSYYNGFYFQAFLKENSPILSGGQYNSDAFGIAVNLDDGGII